MIKSVTKEQAYDNTLITIEAALDIIFKSINPLPREEVRLIEALNRVLAEDVYADSNIPLLDNSAMDGYAIKAHDSNGASNENPKTLTVIENLRAGYCASKRVTDGEAIRIMTGAPLPEGADSVIMVEYTEKEGETCVKLFREVRSGENVRRAGEDIRKGELVLSKGTLLTSAHLGMLASVGKSIVLVTRRPKVAVLATGDEVIDIDEKIEPGKLRSSNTYTLCSQVLKCGGIPKNLGIAKDNPEELEEKIRGGLDCDVILTSGGVSVGDYDLVKDILAKMGTDIKFWKIAMKPGKPLAFGVIEGTPVFGLPGNPVSSMVSFEVFVRPTMLKMLGQSVDDQKELYAVVEEDIPKKKKGLRYFLRARTEWRDGVYYTRTTGPQGSGILKSMILANSMIVLGEEEEDIKKGKKINVKFF